LKTVLLQWKTRGEKLYGSLLEINVPIHKLVSITTYGVPAMTNKNVGLIGLCKKDRTFPYFFSYHCIIHQQVINFQHVMSTVQETLNSISVMSTL